MNMLLHHQKCRNFTDGTYVNIGEDGCPYADNELLIVADGLGGRGGYPHTKLNPAIFNCETFYSNFIAPIVGLANDNYAKFVTNSFRELFELNDKYFSSSATMRTSGYFASRLVTAIALYALKFNPEFRRDVIFDNIRRMEGEMQKNYIDSIRNRLANLIQFQLSEIANRMGLELESKTKGSYLLPTTLTIALINETLNGVDVLYLWAGDSRGYLWNTDGLAQITDDHERDETMTNLITLTKPFQLEGRLFKADKPTILFNATDGCYKCPCFASAFDLEYLFLLAIKNSNSFEETAKILDEQFGKYGTHDDSNTIALTSFGYESFYAIKEAVNHRLDYLQENIIQKLPDILERDYQDELNRVDEQMEGGIFAVKDALIEIEPIAEFVKNSMTDESYTPYLDDLSLLNKRIDELNKAKEKQKENITRWVKYYWLRKPCLKKFSIVQRNLFHGDTYEKFAQMEAECSEERQRYVDTHTKVLEELKENIAIVFNMQDSILSMEAHRSKDIREQLSLNLKSARGLLDKLDENIVRGKIDKIFYRYFKRDDEITDLTHRYERIDGEAMSGFAYQIFNGTININDIPMPRGCRIAIESYLKELHNITETKKEIYAEMNVLKDKHLMNYWTARLCDLIMPIRCKYFEIIPAEIKSCIADNIGDLQTKRDEIAHCLEVRNQLYDIYSKSYYRYFEESVL